MSVKLITTDTINLSGGTQGQVLTKGTGNTLNWSNGGGGGESYTFNNGLDENSGTVGIGGSLNGNTELNVGNSSITFADTNNYKAYGIIDGGAGYVTLGSISDTKRAFLSLGGDDSSVFEYATNRNGGIYSRLTFDDTSMSVADNINNIGLQYIDDYSTNFTSRSLVDKAYVDSVSFPALKQSGTNSGSPFDKTFNLGDHTLFTIADSAYTSSFTLWSDNGGTQGAVLMGGYKNDGSGGQLGIRTNGIDINLADNTPGSESNIQIVLGQGRTGIEITETKFSKGMYYAADYSANFEDRSLVDKAYVDAAIAAAIAAL